MTATAVPHAGRRAVLLASILGAVLATASDCDVGCELPDPSGPDGWRRALRTDHPAPAATGAGSPTTSTPTPG